MQIKDRLSEKYTKSWDSIMLQCTYTLSLWLNSGKLYGYNIYKYNHIQSVAVVLLRPPNFHRHRGGWPPLKQHRHRGVL